MNRQTFSEYLEQPSKLYQLSLTELQGLVLAYPYAANLRLLLLLKAKMENHPRAADILQQAAARTFDRAFLFETLQELERNGLDGLQLPQEKLELHSLDNMELAPLDRELTSDSEVAVANVLNAEAAVLPADGSFGVPDYTDELGDYEEESTLEEALSTLSEPSASQGVQVGKVIEFDAPSSVKPRAESSVLPTAIVISELVTAMFHPSSSQPQAPAALDDLLAVATATAGLPNRLVAHKERQLAALRSRQQPDQMALKARQSVSESDEVASATLAKLLVKQGQYERAIKMYQRLSLQIPTKSATFAALIKELEDKL